MSLMPKARTGAAQTTVRTAICAKIVIHFPVPHNLSILFLSTDRADSVAELWLFGATAYALSSGWINML